jgi:hypothetical protein
MQTCAEKPYHWGKFAVKKANKKDKKEGQKVNISTVDRRGSSVENQMVHTCA